MQSEQHEQQNDRWDYHAVFNLAVGLVGCLLVGLLATLLVRRIRPDLNLSDQRFISFLISSATFQGAGLLLVHFFLREHDLAWKDFLGFTDPRLGPIALYGAATGILVLPPALGLNWLSEQVLTRLDQTPEIQPSVQILELSVLPWQRVFFGIAALVLAPLIEEILFRGILFRFLKQLGWRHFAIIASSILFGVIHGSVMTLVPLSFLAVILALLYEKTGNLLAPIVAHSLFNAVNFFQYLFWHH